MDSQVAEKRRAGVKSDDECRRVLEVARESINVLGLIYDNFAERAIAVGKSSKEPKGGDHVDTDAKG